MMGSTHALAGLIAGYAIGVQAGRPLWPDTAVLGAACALGAILPDIDHPNSLIRKRTGVLGTLAGWWMTHRGITHTVPGAVAVGVVAALLLPELIALAVFIGYCSHLLLDACTRAGVPLAWPFTWQTVRLLPRPLQVRTGTWREQGFVLLMMGGLVAAEYLRLRPF